MIHPAAELILIDRLVAHALVVVGHPRTGGQRITGQQRPGDRIDSRLWNRVSGKLAPRRSTGSVGPGRGGVVNRDRAPAGRLGEYALALQQCGHSGDHGAPNRLPLPLIVDEEECPVLSNRTAHYGTELVAEEFGFVRHRGGEKVPGVQCLMPQEFETASVKSVASGLRGQFDDAAVEAPELRRRTVAFDLELLDGVDVREERHLSRVRVEETRAVHARTVS